MIDIKFEKLNNTRDLGGTVTVDGRVIKLEKLIRSGQLGRGSRNDISRLAGRVSLVVDFRTDSERAEVPDPAVRGADNIHLPVIDSLAAGVSRDAESDEDAFRMLARDPAGAAAYMCRTYEGFVTSETARTGYSAFLRLLLVERGGAALWHCTVGKDRAGFATVIVLEALGVDRDIIRADYLKTNENVEPEIQMMIRMFATHYGGMDAETESALRKMFEASEEYLDAAYAKISELYGDFAGFLRDGLEFGDADIERMRRMYLE